MSALCSDDYYEDTAGQCDAISAGEVLTIEAIMAKYGVVITGETDEDVIVLYLDDPEDTPVGSIHPRNEDAVATNSAEPAKEQESPQQPRSPSRTLARSNERATRASPDVDAHSREHTVRPHQRKVPRHEPGIPRARARPALRSL